MAFDNKPESMSILDLQRDHLDLYVYVFSKGMKHERAAWEAKRKKHVRPTGCASRSR